jgi:hypothetical protein
MPKLCARCENVVVSRYADAGQGVDSFSITSQILLWISWSRIAIKQESAALSARQRATVLTQEGRYCGDELNEELEAVLVIITASANALEAVYGGLLARAPSLVPPDNTRPDWRKILLALEGCFELDQQKVESWRTQLERLFAIKRNAVVHFKEPSRALEIHPLGLRTSPEHCEHTLEEGELSVELLLDILNTCGSSPLRTADVMTYRTEFQVNSAELIDLRRHLVTAKHGRDQSLSTVAEQQGAVSSTTPSSSHA